MLIRHRLKYTAVFRPCLFTCAFLLAALPGSARPVPTTTSAGGLEDQPVEVALGSVVTDSPGASALITITQLPPVSMGQCQQFDGTPIASPPAVVSDPLGRVRFLPAPHENGNPLTSLVYTATDPMSGQVSAPHSVVLGVRPVNDAPLCINSFAGLSPPWFEDQPRYVQINVNDPDLLREGDTSTITIVSTVSPLFMAIYQVGDDNATVGAQIPNNSVITNPDRLVYCVPTPNYAGNGANLIWKVTDAAGVSSPALFEVVDILPANDPPFAINTLHQATQLYPEFALGLSYGDIDPGDILTVTFTSLPTNGEIYKNSVAPENLITSANNTVPGSTPLRYKKVAPGLGVPFDSVQFTVSDGLATSEPATATINYIYENVPPQHGTIPSVTVMEDSGYTEIVLNVTDTDSPPNEIRWYITKLPTKGTLQVLNVLGSGWITVTSPGTQAFPKAPTIIVRYEPLPNANTLGGAPDSFEYRVMDQEDENPVRPTVPITITAVNDAPVVTGPAVAFAHITVPGGQHINAVVTTLSVNDDAGDQPVDVTITSTFARALFLNSTAGLSEFDQPTPTSITFIGTISAINAAFAAGLQFDPATYGTGSITVTVNDMGNTGEELPPVSLTGTWQVTVPVVP